MSVLRGRPPGLAGGINGASRAYCSSLKACPAPKSPTKARLCAVHTVHLQEGSLLPEPPTSLPCAPAYPSRPGFSNGLSYRPWEVLTDVPPSASRAAPVRQELPRPVSDHRGHVL